MTERITVLVVEDDLLVSEVIASVLEDHYAVVTVDTSAEALAFVRGGTAGLILLDCTLPGGVDPSLVTEADEFGVPVVLMSGDAARTRSVADSPRPFLLKPFTLTALVDTVASALSGSAHV